MDCIFRGHGSLPILTCRPASLLRLNTCALYKTTHERAAFGYLFPNTELMLLFPPIPIKAKYFVIGYAIIELYLGMSNNPGDNVAHFAHLGGAAIGILIVLYWQNNKNKFF